MPGDIPPIERVQEEWPEFFELGNRRHTFNKPARTKEENLELLRIASEFLGRTPTMGDIKALRAEGFPIPIGEAYQQRFQGYLNALNAAGLEPSDQQEVYRYSDDELLDDLMNLCLVAGRLVTRHEVKNRQVTSDKHPSISPFIERFESFENALEQSGALEYFSNKTLKSVASGEIFPPEPMRHRELVAKLNELRFTNSILFLSRKSADVDSETVRYGLPYKLDDGSKDYLFFEHQPESLYVARATRPRPDKDSIIYSVTTPLSHPTTRKYFPIDRNRSFEVMMRTNNGSRVHKYRGGSNRNYPELVNSLELLSRDILYATSN